MSLDHRNNVSDHHVIADRTSTSAAQNAKPNLMKQQLQQGKVVSAMSIRYSRGVEIVGFAKAAGMQGVLVDLEHSSIDLDQCMQFTLAALAHQITPVVRVPSTACSFVGRVLDGGAQAIIIPHVRTAQDALDAARAAKFFPDGDRSAIGGLAALQYGSYPTIEANVAINDQVMCVIMIETLEALENLDEIAATPNVDVLLIGTNDMSACLGVPGHHDDKRITEIYERVISVCRKNGKAIGIGGLYARQDLIDKFIKMASGIGRFVMCGSDQDYVLEGARRTAKWLETYSS
jgi:2-keto-3-deoxy-L-rhamnonate aldolase RhmA